jgi:hypothetical protein
MYDFAGDGRIDLDNSRERLRRMDDQALKRLGEHRLLSYADHTRTSPSVGRRRRSLSSCAKLEAVAPLGQSRHRHTILA